MEPLEIIQKTLIWLKENPDRWCRESIRDISDRYCAVGVINVVQGGTAYDVSRETILTLNLISDSSKGKFLCSEISWINDHHGYDTVIEVLEKTLANNAEQVEQAPEKDLASV